MTVTFKISWALNQPNQQTVSLCGDKGGLLLTDDSMKLITTQGRYQADLMPRIFEDKYEKLSNFYGHIHVFENALKVLDGGNDHGRVSDQEGRGHERSVHH